MWGFIPIAAVVTITPGAATAIIVRSAMRHGMPHGIRTIAGNETGVVWALLSVVGVSAVIAASEIAFAALKVIGAVVLVCMGIQSLRRSRRGTQPFLTDACGLRSRRRPFRDGLITSLANPKLAVFFVALFPQFVGHRDTALPTTLPMAVLIVVFDFVWYSTLAAIASRAKRKFDQTRLARWLERLSGTMLIGLGIRVATEHR